MSAIETIDVPVGTTHWRLRFRAEDLIPLKRPAPRPIGDPRSAIVEALEHPLRFEAFRRALTPDDRIALVVDDSLPQLQELVSGILEYLASAGIPPENVTAIGAAGSSQVWVHDLPEAYANVKTEVHQPEDRQKQSYLAATKDGRRIYLNRSLVDAEQSIILTGRKYDPLLGYYGPEGMISTTLADSDTQRGLVAKISPQSTPKADNPLLQEAREISWLLGAPFYVQVIEDSGDSINRLIAGLAETSPDGIAAQDERWKGHVDQRADTVVVTLTGDPERHDFAALARAVACGAHVVKPQGRIILLSEAMPDMGEGIQILRRWDDPPEAAKAVFQGKPLDASSAIQWAWGAGMANLFVASEIRPEIVEEIFATPVGPDEVQKLLEEPGKVLLLTDAHKSWITVQGEGKS